MHSYAAFGTQLSCTFELPELAPAPIVAGTGWTLRVSEKCPPSETGALLGVETVHESIRVRLFSNEGGFRLRFDDTGTFELHVRDRVIVWHPGHRRDAAAVRADVLGRVMAVAAHAEGGLVLHASAVSIDGRAVAFLGPKYAGKSTTAMALVRRGAQLLTDDTLVLRFDSDGVRAMPGVHRVRLWEDSVRALKAAADVSLGAKPTVGQLPDEQLQRAEVPLDTCYVLRPSDMGSRETVSREALSPLHAALACVSFSKLGALTGGSEGPVVLERATRVARMAPFFAATVHRDLSRLDTLGDDVLRWHRPAASSGGGR